MSWEHLYFTRTKAPDPCKRAERQTDKGDAAPLESPSSERREYTISLRFSPKGWCPTLREQRDQAPAAAPSPRGRRGRERGSEQQGEGPRLLGQVPAATAGPSTAAPSPGTGKSRRKEPGAALGAQPDPALSPGGSRCPPTDTGPPMGARPGSWPEGRGTPGGLFQSVPWEGGKGKRDAPALP